MAEPQPPYPLFPPLSLLNDQARSALPINLEVLQRLEATLANWKGSDKLDPEASLTFNELRVSAKRAS